MAKKPKKPKKAAKAVAPSAAAREYAGLLEERRDAYAEHIRGMAVDPAIIGWAGRMEGRYGPEVKVWHNTLGWLEALMVVRYGEAVDAEHGNGLYSLGQKHWPPATTIADWGRAQDWESGKEIPHAVIRGAEMTLEGEE